MVGRIVAGDYNDFRTEPNGRRAHREGGNEESGSVMSELSADWAYRHVDDTLLGASGSPASFDDAFTARLFRRDAGGRRSSCTCLSELDAHRSGANRVEPRGG